jgi:solute carrier family 25 carnitine/acylcarnitine transporter 20/29
MVLDTFIAGLGYGATNVLVGQPLDTIKTRMQALSGNPATKVSSWKVAKEIIAHEGLAGLYKGGTVILLGGSLFRSAQFGVYEFALSKLRGHFGATEPEHRIFFKMLDPQVIVAGFAGGVGRGVVEAPFEFIKTRIQVDHAWQFRELLSGSGATMFRNSFLFSSFVVYVDISKQLVPGGLGPFLTGAICSNLAWFTIWPIDVVKSQIQSGNFENKSFGQLLWGNIRSGALFRGLAPGLARSFMANGCAMVVYNKILEVLAKAKKPSAD